MSSISAHARGAWRAQIYGLDGANLKLLADHERKAAIKCGTFGASDIVDRKFATGDFEGRLQMWDLESPKIPVYSTQAHAAIVNGIDGCGGPTKGYGPPELVTCGRDGCVRVWDVRQEDAPVAAFEPSDTENARCALCAFAPAVLHKHAKKQHWHML